MLLNKSVFYGFGFYNKISFINITSLKMKKRTVHLQHLFMLISTFTNTFKSKVVFDKTCTINEQLYFII